LCITHLGLLGERSTLGWPNRLTVIRALLPALAPTSRWTSLVAMATDLADGRVARRGGESAFGAYADPIADGVFWSWFALRWETNRWLRWVPLSAFAATVAGISAAYFSRGRTIDYPRPLTIRYASAAAQIVLTLRALRKQAKRRDRRDADPASEKEGLRGRGRPRGVTEKSAQWAVRREGAEHHSEHQVSGNP